jgi:divalent metal cation (Fe/Co/Zn/Cd) transporter
VKIFALYTLARVAIFAASYGLIWLVFGRWIEWDAISALYTALIAMVLSSIIALTLLRSLRGRLAEQVATRAEKAKAAYEQRSRREDDDD